MNTRIFEIKTIKSVVVKNLFEVVKQYIKETNLKITNDGIRISSIDSSNNSFTFVNLYANKFESYICNKDMVIGLDMVTLYKTIKTSSRKDIITLYMNTNDEENFCVELLDPAIGKRKTIKIPILILDEQEKLFIKEMDYELTINISTSQFQQIIKDIHILEGKIVELKSVDKQMIISCVDGIAQFSTTMNEIDNVEDSNVIKFANNSEESSNEIIQGKFKLNYLLNFIKASHLCENMNIRLSNDKPVVLEYYIADLGVLQLLLVPFV